MIKGYTLTEWLFFRHSSICGWTMVTDEADQIGTKFLCQRRQVNECLQLFENSNCIAIVIWIGWERKKVIRKELLLPFDGVKWLLVLKSVKKSMINQKKSNGRQLIIGYCYRIASMPATTKSGTRSVTGKATMSHTNNPISILVAAVEKPYSEWKDKFQCNDL